MGFKSFDCDLSSCEIQRDLDDNGKLRTVLGRLHGLVEAANVECPHLGPDAVQLDSVTFLELMAQFSDSPKIAAAANTLAAALLGVEADEVSALYMVHYLKSGGGLQNMVLDRKNGNQYLRNSNGMIILITAMLRCSSRSKG